MKTMQIILAISAQLTVLVTPTAAQDQSSTASGFSVHEDQVSADASAQTSQSAGLIGPSFNPVADGAGIQPSTPSLQVPPCSWVAVNGNCMLTIHRLIPVSPPKIFMRHGSKVKVVLEEALPFEKPIMFLKSTSEAPPVDQISQGLPTLIQTLSSFQVSTFEPADVRRAAATASAVLVRQYCPDVPGLHSYQEITRCQNAIANYIKTTSKGLVAWSLKAVCMLRPLFLPQGWDSLAAVDPRGACKVMMAGYTFPKDANSWGIWKQGFDQPEDALADLIADLRQRLDALSQSIEDSKQLPLDPGQYQAVSASEADLKAGVSAYNDLLGRMRLLKGEVDGLPLEPPKVWAVISDKTPKDKNYVTPVWDVNLENRLAPAAARVKADKTQTDLTYETGKLTDPSTATTLVELNIQFMNLPPFEISGGVAIPIKSYHTYAVALSQQAANAPTGSCPGIQSDCGIVTVTRQVAFLPDAIVSRTLYESPHSWGRFALMISSLVGYNTATTSAALGGGPSLAFGSFVLNIPVIADRDQALLGGYTVGGSAGAAMAPMTKNVWRFSPALGISVRVPIGNGGK